VSPAREHQPQVPSNETFIDAETVARRLGICTRTLHRYVSNGTVPKPVKLSARCVRWRDSDIEAFIRSCQSDA
jgi:predicted DNA-binding transcriptional regulator AlpA